jgi:predicted RNA binding protein YcfA (HicA-like mRNA interferase family)
VPLSSSDCAEIREALSGKAVGFRYSEVVRWLTKAGWDLASSRGSHRVWRAPAGRRIVLVERSGHLLPVYVKQASRAILDEGGCE